jgi:hypothetical protein
MKDFNYYLELINESKNKRKTFVPSAASPTSHHNYQKESDNTLKQINDHILQAYQKVKQNNLESIQEYFQYLRIIDESYKLKSLFSIYSELEKAKDIMQYLNLLRLLQLKPNPNTGFNLVNNILNEINNGYIKGKITNILKME